MKRTAILGLLLLVGACRSGPYKEARPGEDIEGRATITVHPTLTDDVYVARQSTARTADGRLRIQVLFESREKDDLSLTVRTHWYDESGMLVEESAWQPFFLPGRATQVYEAGSIDARPVRASVAVRPLSEERE